MPKNYHVRKIYNFFHLVTMNRRRREYLSFNAAERCFSLYLSFSSHSIFTRRQFDWNSRKGECETRFVESRPLHTHVCVRVQTEYRPEGIYSDE